MPESEGSTSSSLEVLAFAGSLRENSYNRALLREGRRLAPEAMRVELVNLGDIPLYNADRDTDALRPDSVASFKEAIGAADGLLIGCPEYNHGVTGVLKNAIDWASRPARQSVLRGKPIGIMGTSPQPVGTARAQEQLKQVLEPTLAHVMPHPGVLVGGAEEKFDTAGRLTDEATKRRVGTFMGALSRWIRRFQGQPDALERAE